MHPGAPPSPTAADLLAERLGGDDAGRMLATMLLDVHAVLTGGRTQHGDA